MPLRIGRSAALYLASHTVQKDFLEICKEQIQTLRVSLATPVEKMVSHRNACRQITVSDFVIMNDIGLIIHLIKCIVPFGQSAILFPILPISRKICSSGVIVFDINHR